jgi:CRISPR-associated protein Csm1
VGIKEVQLAALLHDIGKFWQRSDKSVKGKHHEELGGRFCREYLPEEIKEVAGLVSLHGSPSDYLSSEYYPLKIVVISDWLSAEEREERVCREKGKPKEEPLISIFSTIDIGKGKVPQEMYYLPKRLLLNKENVFPRVSIDKKSLTAEYENLWNYFIQEIKQLRELSDFDSYFITLYFLLQKYTWAIPSAAYVDIPDISLFDHLKTTCAIASCLKDAEDTYLSNLLSALSKLWKNETLDYEEEKTLNQKKFLLIGGDVSGVQKFIYSITSKGAAKGLRGRSLYLELMSEAIAKFILRRLKLPITNLLYCGGGHFYILAPISADENLERVREEITKRLLKTHHGELYLVLDWIRLSGSDFQRERFGDRWIEINESIAKKKKNKFSEILDEQYHSEIFGPKGEGKETCNVCVNESNYPLIQDEDRPEIKKCRLCESLERLAKDIAEAKYMVEIIEPKEMRNLEEGGWKWALAQFGVGYEFIKTTKDLKKVNAERIVIYKLNDTNFLDADVVIGDTPISFGFRFLLNTPLLEFDELAENSKGLKRWAIIRADIDNLGRIFSEGLGENRTISRVSTLSSMLSLFFCGWIDRICDEYKERIYGIYSGGDDLFIVGSWSDIPEISKDIYRNFREYTCQNPNITLSGGITIAPTTKYPLYKAAELAGKALDEKSKNFNGKDAITFLDIPMKWEKFNGDITNLKDKLFDLLNDGISRGLLQKFYSIYYEFDKKRRRVGKVSAKYDDRHGRWRWLLAYVISRTKVSKEKKPVLKEVEKLFRENIEYSPIAVRWVEFLTRKEG